MIFFSMAVYAAPVYTDNVAGLLSELSIMQGDPDGNMRYNDMVSRDECTKIVVALSPYRDSVALGSKSSPFSDVPYTHWASPYVTVGIKNGLCKGYLDATFRPYNTVLYEEAVTMFLRVLGYTDEDFGSSWPNGQVGIAKNIGLLDNVDKTIGQELTRRDVAALAYNTLISKSKGSQATYLSTLNRTIIDDVVLISTMDEDPSVAEGKIFTSNGTYNVADSLDKSGIGKRGSIVLRNGDTVVSFIPNGTSSGNDEHMVFSALGNGIVAYKNGTFSQIVVSDDTVFYKNSAKVSANSALTSLKMGDVIRVSYKSNGEIDYIMCTEGSTIGPKTVYSTNWYEQFGADSSVTVMRNGEKASVTDVKTNDIAYYLKGLNIALVYSDKATGIYESATPNKDAPTSVTVSGTTYKLEGVDAFRKLSSSGSFNYGDTVTLLLGKDGEVADVLSNTQLADTVYGFLTKVGTKETTVLGKTVTKPYVEIVLPDGEVAQYITNKSYDSIINRVVSVKFSEGIATISTYNSNYDINGKFVWGSGANTLGSYTLAGDLKIIETSSIEAREAATVGPVYPQRLNGLKISKNSVLYASKNSAGHIDRLILNDVTGDMHTYGIVTKVNNRDSGLSVSGNYEYLVDGTTGTLSTQNKSFSVSTGQAVKIKGDGRSVTSMIPLSAISSTKVSDINGSMVTADGKTYILSDKVQIYMKKTSENEYIMLSYDEFKEMINEYKAYIYTDKAYSDGGRIRVIILK